MIVRVRACINADGGHSSICSNVFGIFASLFLNKTKILFSFNFLKLGCVTSASPCINLDIKGRVNNNEWLRRMFISGINLKIKLLLIKKEKDIQYH